MNYLQRLLGRLSYHRAAEGEEYHREAQQRARVEAALRELAGQHTEEEMREMLGENPEPYLIDWERDVVKYCVEVCE